MVKQTKTFKKGNVTKKALSAILAASMVMTSSSFVMAAPVEVEDVAVEAAVATEEENVGVRLSNPQVTVEEATYTGSAVRPKVTVVADDGTVLTEGSDYTLEFGSNNINVTEHASVTVNFTGAYLGTEAVTKEFSIKPLVLNSANAKVTNNIAGYVYTGQKQIIAAPTVTAIGADATKVTSAINGKNFKYEAYDSNYDLKSVGAQKAKLVEENGNIVVDASIGTYNFTIEKADFTDDNVTVTSNPVLYTGSPVAANVVVKAFSTNEVVDPSTYTIRYYKDDKVASGPQTDCGTYKIEIVSNGTGNFKEGTVSTENSTPLSYVIQAGGFDDIVKGATIAGTVKDEAAYTYNLTYNGKEQSIAPSDIVIPGLTQDVDYTVDCSGAYATDAEDNAITLRINGKNKFVNEYKDLTINMKPLIINKNDFTITAKANKTSGNPTISDMVVTIKKGDLELARGTDFWISDLNVNNRTLRINGGSSTKNNYTTVDSKRDSNSYITVSYTQATKKLIEKATITSISAMNWTGKQITPSVEVKDGTDTLKEGRDYTVSYGTNVDSGVDAGKVIVTGIGDYEGTQEAKFNINGTSIASFQVDVSDVTVDAAKAGNGKSTPRLSFANGASAPSDLTFTTKYYRYNAGESSNHYKGAELNEAAFKTLTVGSKVVVEVNGTGKYFEAAYGEYEVVDATDIATVATVAPIATHQYTGKAIEPAVVVTPNTLKKGTDYTVSYAYNMQVGTAYAIVTGIGTYAGEIATPFKIVGEMDQTIEVLAAQERDLGNGSRTLNSKNTKIKYTAETAVTFESSNPDVVTVDAEGNIKYTGIGEATITIKAAAENGYKAATKEVKVVVGLAKPSFTPFSKNNAFTLTSSTVKGAEKFEVEYATKKDFSNSKTKTFATTSAGKIRQVKVSAADKKTYYVRVRAISGTETSAWSATKTVATK